MRNQKIVPKKLMSLVMAVALTVTTIPINANAASMNVDSLKKTWTDLYANDISDKLSDGVKQSLLEKSLDEDNLLDVDVPFPKDQMEVIVTLNEDSLLEKKQELKYDSMDMAQFMETKQGKSHLKKINESKKEVIEDIEDLGIEAEITYSYYTILNGFAMTVEYQNIADIEKLPQVKDVTISTIYEKEETTETQLQSEIESACGAGEDYANNTDYQGEGMVIGILDTGLDYNHEAFANAPDEQTIVKSDLDKMMYEGPNEDGIYTCFSYASYFAVSSGKLITADDLYVSPKVPFAFDYADVDTDVNPSEKSIEDYGNEHGTHVAGIAAGKTVDSNGKVNFLGVAPEAQLCIFKVFSDKSSGASTVDILAALCDAMMLDIDVINMSLGSSGGFGAEESGSLLEAIYGDLDESGIIVCCSAGNSYSSSYGGTKGDFTLTSNPDNGIVSSASSYPMNLSVASINALSTKCFKVGDSTIAYNDVNGHDFAALLGNGSYEYVMVPGTGDLSDYNNIDVKDKIAVVMRGGLTFEAKATNAAQNGAKGCIIYNNRDGYVLSMSISDYRIPTVSISFADGQMMGQQAEKKLTVDSSVEGSKTMSAFSSWGPIPSLELKPEITAPGGGIYSSVPGKSNYEYMDGTSMASPYMAGSSAILKQYLKKQYPAYTDEQLETLSNRIFMSTAKIVKDDNDTAYSPRKQGAGVVNINSALNSPAYLYVKGKDMPKIELGDDKEEAGVYNLSFHVKNMYQTALSYDISTMVQTESVTSDGKFIAQKGYAFNDADTSKITVSGGGTLSGTTLTVKPGGDAAVNIKVVLTEADKAYMKENFENGIYVEGFACLNAVNDTAEDLSIPYLAFFGDWTKAPLMDGDSFTDEQVNMFASDVYGGIYDLGWGTLTLYRAGSYLFKLPEGYNTPKRSKEKIAMGLSYLSDGFNLMYYVPLGLLRGAKTVDISITDTATDEIYYEYTQVNARKSRENNGNILPSYVGEMYPSPGGYIGLPSNTTLRYEAVAHVDYDEPQSNTKNTFSFDMYVDNEAPCVVNREDLGFYLGEDGRYYIDVTFTDNHYLMGASLYSAGTDMFTGSIVPAANYYSYMTPFASEDGEDVLPNTEKTLTFDVTDFCDKLYGGKFFIVAYDYALNACYYEVNTEYTAVEGISLDKHELTMKQNGVAELKAQIAPLTATNQNVTWTSSDSEVAMVKDGQVTALKQGTAVITAKSLDNSRITDSCTVTVTAEAVDPILPTAITLNKQTLSMYKDTYEILTPSFEPYNATEKTVTWTSDKESVATVENGKVTALAVGTAVITAKTANGLTAECSIEVLESKGSFSMEGTVLKSYTGTDGSVVIPDNVTEIAASAFENNTYIKNVIIPDSVTKIGDKAFSRCSNLVSVTMPKTMESIGKQMFYICKKLETVTIPEGITSIPQEAFYHCDGIIGITIPSSVKEINHAAFNYCVGLKSIVIPDSVTTMNGSVHFGHCTQLESVTISSALKSLPKECFVDDIKLTQLPDLKNVNTLGEKVFSGIGIKNLVLPATVTNIGVACFSLCKSLETVELKGKSITVASTVFSGCPALTSFTGDITSIGASMFVSTGLTQFTVPEGVKTIGNYAFNNCTKLENITFTKNSALTIKTDLTNDLNQSFCARALGGCTSFKGFKVETGNTTLSVDSQGSLYDYGKTVLLCANPNLSGEITFPATLKDIGAYAFYGNTTISKVTFGDSVENIGAYAFGGTNALTDIEFNSTLKTIGNNCFECTSLSTYEKAKALTSLTFPDSMVSIGNQAFKNVSWKLTDIDFGNGIKTIGDNAFQNCNDLKGIVLPDSMETIGAYAFDGCKSAETINIGGTVTVSANAFKSCINAKQIVMGSRAQTIGEYAFYGSSNVENIQWSSALTSIGNYAFADCNKLTGIDLSSTKVKTIGDYAFRNAYNAGELKLPETLTKIGAEAFSYIGNESSESFIHEIIIPAATTSIMASAFTFAENIQKFVVAEGNTAYISDENGIVLDKNTGALLIYPSGCLVKEYTIPESTTQIPMNVLKGANNLEKLTIPATVTLVGNSAVRGCENLKSVIFESGNKEVEIGRWSFADNPKLTEIKLPKGLTTLGLRAFENDSTLITIELPGTLTSIGSYVFNGCTSLQSVSLADGITSLKWSMFNGCSEFSDIYIPATVSYIETSGSNMPFKGCTGLENIYVDNNNKWYKDIDGVLYSINGKTLIYYSEGRKAEEYRIPEGVTRISSNAFAQNKYIKTVEMPSTLMRVGDCAFLGCSSLENCIFNSATAPLLECGSYMGASTVELARYGNFKDYYFAVTKDGQVEYKDLGLNLYYPEGGTGYTSYIWKKIFDTKNGSVTEMTPDNMMSVGTVTVQTLDSGSHNVTITWEKPQWVDYYIVERSVANLYEADGQSTYVYDGFEKLADVTDATSYVDLTASFGLTYAYRVTAVYNDTYGPAGIATVKVAAINDEEKAVQSVIDAIEALKPIDMLSVKDSQRVESARIAYDALTEAQKALVPNYAALTAAEDKIASEKDKMAAENVKELIAAIGSEITLKSEEAIMAARKAYEALNDEQKKLVDNYSALTAAEETLSGLKAGVKAAEDAITAIGNVTLKSEEYIKAARAAYEVLNDEQKASVKNYSTLTAAEESLLGLKAGVKATEDAIAVIGKVSLNSEEAIKAARKAYDALTDEQKASVRNLVTLTAAETELARLKKIAVPGTGDASSSTDWACLMLVALGAGFIIIRRRRRSKAQ